MLFLILARVEMTQTKISELEGQLRARQAEYKRCNNEIREFAGRNLSPIEVERLSQLKAERTGLYSEITELERKLAELKQRAE